MSKKHFKITGADLFFSDASMPVKNPEPAVELKINPAFKALIPPLSEDEYSQLEENLLQYGIREAISVWEDTIIDGHNRYELARKHKLPYSTVSYDFETETEAVIWIIKNQFGRRNLSAYDRSILALRLKPVIYERSRENQGRRNDILLNPVSGAGTRTELAEIAGVSHDTISKVEKIERLAPPEIKEQLKRGDISINNAFRRVNRSESPEMSQTVSPAAAVDGTYNVIYVNRAAMRPDDLKAIHIPAEKNAVLFMWSEPASLGKALRLMASWGFSYRTCAVLCKDGAEDGYWVEERHEMLLIGTKGHIAPMMESRRISGIYGAGDDIPRNAYYQGIIEEMFPDGRYLELFAHDTHSEKWTVWNNNNLSDEETSGNESNI